MKKGNKKKKRERRRIKSYNENRKQHAKGLGQQFVPYQKTQLSNEAFYVSPEWRAIRYKVLNHYGAKCMLCNTSREDGIQMHVDHIKPRSKRPDLELEFGNLQVLCRDCNLGKMADDDTDFRP